MISDAHDRALTRLDATQAELEVVRAERDRCRQALQFYSDGFAYLTPEGWQRIWRDGGKTARDALAGPPNQEEVTE